MQDWQTACSITDTLWGLIAKPNQEAYEKIYEIKSRDKSKALILFLKNKENFWKYCDLESEELNKLIEENWPGALTIIIPKSKLLPSWLNPDFDSIAFRVPNSKSIQKLFDSSKEDFLLSTSANLSGEESVTDYNSASEKFGNSVDLVLQAEADEDLSQQASTIVKFNSNGAMEILRQGTVSVITNIGST